ncbi:hypothetical protein VNO77_37654 [Canavalia gladiata]|uniref:TIR domain-containing protein n=1 Tax=Canavalia gladiata TaxID=3824 RepID=A0AAN9PYK7_CANGL
MINDVFISFCGKDTGGSFASALYTTLTDAGVFVYRHDDSIVRKDEQISVSVLKAIEASRISIIVFSRNYADSRWCMQEMEKIMECHKTKGQKVVPVFYGVNPFDVRNQRGMFGKAFENLMRRMLAEEDKVSSWRDAFDEACKISGFTGTDYLEGLSLKLPKEYAIRFNTRAFEKMKKLRLLQFDNVQFDGDFKYLPRKLTWLRWRGFPLKRIPAEFLLTHLAVIELKYSNLKQLWEKSQMLVNLKVLKLSHSQRLTTTPDFSYMPNLEKLVLKDCPNLFEVSHTIGSLNKLLLLNLRDCRGLQNLPRSIYTLKYLKTLILAGCSKIDKLEEDLEQMKSLTTLIANNTAITKVPFSILRLKYLEYISLCGYEGYSHDVIPSIDWSRIISVEEEIVLSWKRAFREAAGISGIVLLNSRNENEDIKKIVEHVTHLLNRTELFIVDHPGTKAIQGLALKLENTTCLKTKAFKKMYNLRLLQLASVLLDGDYKHLSRDLRWLCWNGFPLSYIPAEFHQESLVAIELKYSNLKQIWTKGQMLENLKILNLSHSHNLTKTPDFSYLPNLEKLLLKDCPSLSMVSHTIECLNKLLLMNLKDCSRLHNLPRSIYKLKSLETMILSGCLMIDKLEEDLEQMESLTTLMADNTSITEVPFSIVKLKSIGYISLCGFEGFSRDVFPSIIQSWMLSTYNSISMVPKSAMSSLVALDVQCSSSYSTSSAFKDLPNLQSLFVECDSEYQLTCDVQSILDTLEAKNYKGLEASAATLQISDIKSSPLIECRRQVQISRSKNFLKSLLIQMGTKCEAPNISRDSTLQNVNRPGDSSLLLSDNYSDRLTFSCKGSSVEFELPQMNGFNLKSMMLFIVYSSPNNLTLESCQNVLIINYTKRTILVYKRDALISFKDEEWKSIRSNLEPGNKVKVIVLFGHGFMVEKTTVYLLNCEPIDKNMEHYHIKENCGTVSDMALDKSITVFGGNKLPADKNIIITGADGKGPDDGSISVQLNLPDEDVEDEEQPIPLRKRKASNYQIVQSSKQVKTSTEPTQCSSQEMNQERNQYVEVEYSTNPHIHPNHEQMQVEVNVNIFEHLSANLQSEENALPSENQPVDESRQIDPPHWISLQANNVDQEKEKSVETLQEVPKGINKLFDFEAMSQLINDDPLSALENMFSGEISVSSKTQQSITQVDISEVESSFVNQLLEDLKILLFNKQDMNDVLLRELDIEKVKFIFEKLSKVHDQLPAATRAFIFHSQKFYYEALTHKKNYVHGISRLSGYEHSKKEFAEKALKIKDNKTKLATLTASSQEKLHVFNTQIVALEKQLQDLKKQRDNLQQDITKCEEQKQNINIESENLARQTMSILTKIKETEDNVETASVGFEVSKAIFEKLKSKLPF